VDFCGGVHTIDVSTAKETYCNHGFFTDPLSGDLVPTLRSTQKLELFSSEMCFQEKMKNTDPLMGAKLNLRHIY
jgi:hypothetical protein